MFAQAVVAALLLLASFDAHAPKIADGLGVLLNARVSIVPHIMQHKCSEVRQIEFVKIAYHPRHPKADGSAWIDCLELLDLDEYIMFRFECLIREEHATNAAKLVNKTDGCPESITARIGTGVRSYSCMKHNVNANSWRHPAIFNNEFNISTDAHLIIARHLNHLRLSADANPCAMGPASIIIDRLEVVMRGGSAFPHFHGHIFHGFSGARSLDNRVGYLGGLSLINFFHRGNGLLQTASLQTKNENLDNSHYHKEECENRSAQSADGTISGHGHHFGVAFLSGLSGRWVGSGFISAALVISTANGEFLVPL